MKAKISKASFLEAVSQLGSLVYQYQKVGSGPNLVLFNRTGF